MMKTSGIVVTFALASVVSACSDASGAPNSDQALLSLQRAAFSGPIGSEINKSAIVGAEVLQCAPGDRSGQQVSACEICLTAAINHYQEMYGSFSGNSLKYYHAVVHVTFIKAVSEAMPDAIPKRASEGVWIALPEINTSTNWRVDPAAQLFGGDVSSNVTDMLEYPLDRPFSGSEEYEEMLAKLELPQISSLVRSEAGRCVASRL